jgi:hypothetical protein
MTVDREPAPGEVLYAGDRRMAAVAWKGMVYLREEVESANEAFEQVLDETETGSMEAHRRLLERAAGGQLPERIDDQSTPEFDIFQELIEADCLKAIDVSSHPPGGRAYLNPRITLTGRERLSRLTGSAVTEHVNTLQSTIPILFLTADPTNASRLRLGEELREIQEKLQLARLRHCFRLEQRMSVRPTDVSQALLDVEPQVVHFSGHGTATGALCFENPVGETHPVQPDALAALFEQFAHQVTEVLQSFQHGRRRVP